MPKKVKVVAWKCRPTNGNNTTPSVYGVLSAVSSHIRFSTSGFTGVDLSSCSVYNEKPCSSCTTCINKATMRTYCGKMGVNSTGEKTNREHSIQHIPRPHHTDNRLCWYRRAADVWNWSRLQILTIVLVPPATNVHSGPFFINGLFSSTTWVSRHQKGKSFCILLAQEMMGWQWHQLDHMQIICTWLQTDNQANTTPLSFLQAECPSCHPTNSVKALKTTSALQNS